MTFTELDIDHIKKNQIVYKLYDDEYFICRITKVKDTNQTYNIEFLGGGLVKFKKEMKRVSSLFPVNDIPFDDKTMFIIENSTKPTFDRYLELFGAMVKDALWWYWQEPKKIDKKTDKKEQSKANQFNHHIARAKGFLKNNALFEIANLNLDYLKNHAKKKIDEGTYFNDDGR